MAIEAGGKGAAESKVGRNERQTVSIPVVSNSSPLGKEVEYKYNNTLVERQCLDSLNLLSLSEYYRYSTP